MTMRSAPTMRSTSSTAVGAAATTLRTAAAAFRGTVVRSTIGIARGAEGIARRRVVKAGSGVVFALPHHRRIDAQRLRSAAALEAAAEARAAARPGIVA